MMKNYKSLNEEIDNIKYLLSYKKGSVLIEQEEDSKLKLIQDACKHFDTLSDDVKNSFVVHTSGKTSTGIPIDPLMMCKEPINTSWVKDQDITLLNNLLSLSGNSEEEINEQSSISIDRDGNRINFNLKVELDKLRNGLLGMFASLVGLGVLEERMSFKSFVEGVINAINTTFEDNPQKIKNLIPSFSTLKREIKKVLRGKYSGPKYKVENTSKMEEDIKTALVDWIQSGHVAASQKSKDTYGVTEEEINKFQELLSDIHIDSRLENKDGVEETRIRVKKNGEIINLTESDLKRIVKKVLSEQLVLGLTVAGIMAYRQTAKSKAKRLTKKIKESLKNAGIKNNKIEDGNLNDLMRCVNGWVETNGPKEGRKRVGRDLVRNKGKEDSMEEFESRFPNAVQSCGSKFGMDEGEQKILQDTMVNVIKAFQEKKIHV